MTDLARQYDAVNLVADPLHRLDSCVVTDGGGAVILVSPEVARDLLASAYAPPDA